MCLYLKYLLWPYKWRVELGVWEVAFVPVPEEIVYYFFNFLFNILWISINLAYVSQLGEEDLVYDYPFTSRRESQSIPDMNFFCFTLLFT